MEISWAFQRRLVKEQSEIEDSIKRPTKKLKYETVSPGKCKPLEENLTSQIIHN